MKNMLLCVRKTWRKMNKYTEKIHENDSDFFYFGSGRKTNQFNRLFIYATHDYLYNK
jgi:hypothetical protein